MSAIDALLEEPGAAVTYKFLARHLDVSANLAKKITLTQSRSKQGFNSCNTCLTKHSCAKLLGLLGHSSASKPLLKHVKSRCLRNKRTLGRSKRPP